MRCSQKWAPEDERMLWFGILLQMKTHNMKMQAISDVAALLVLRLGASLTGKRLL